MTHLDILLWSGAGLVLLLVLLPTTVRIIARNWFAEKTRHLRKLASFNSTDEKEHLQ